VDVCRVAYFLKDCTYYIHSRFGHGMAYYLIPWYLGYLGYLVRGRE
jgi:hypothetical protein